MASAPIYFYKTDTLTNLKPNSLIALKAKEESKFSLWVTDKQGLPYPLKADSGGGEEGIQAIANTDGNLVISGTDSVKIINVSSSLLLLINSALQAGDNISSLVNDANYITLAEVPAFVASDYDLDDFTNVSVDPYVRNSELETKQDIISEGKNILIENNQVSVDIPEIVDENDTDRLLAVDDEGNIIRRNNLTLQETITEDKNADEIRLYKPILELNSDLRLSYIVQITVDRLNPNKFYAFGKFDFGVDAGRNIARFNTDGSRDETFNTGIGLKGTFNFGDPYAGNKFIQNEDGSIYITGNFNSYNGVSRNGIAKINYDGSINTDFNVGTGFSQTSNVVGCSLNSLGQLLVAASATGPLIYNGQNINTRLYKINPDGTLVTSFVVTGNNNIINVTVGENDSIYLTGYFTTIQGQNRNGIVRLNSDGTIDNTFNVGAGISLVGNSIVNNILIDSLNRVYIYGSIISYKGVESRGIIRLLSNGNIDTTFNVGSGFIDSSVTFVVFYTYLTSYDTIFISGNFDTYNGVSSSNTIELNLDGSIYEINKGLPTVSYYINSNSKVSELRQPITNNLILVKYNEGYAFENYELTFDKESGRAEYRNGILDETTVHELLPKRHIEALIQRSKDEFVEIVDANTLYAGQNITINENNEIEVDLESLETDLNVTIQKMQNSESDRLKAFWEFGDNSGFMSLGDFNNTSPGTKELTFYSKSLFEEVLLKFSPYFPLEIFRVEGGNKSGIKIDNSEIEIDSYNKVLVKSLESINFEAPKINFSGTTQLGEFTVATLPTPISTAYATVTDALNPIIGQPLTGGGTVKVAVFFNGSSWVVGAGGSLNAIDPNDFVGTDTEKLQQAVDLASSSKRELVIGFNEDRDSYLWLIDEAILVGSNTTIYIEHTKIKLSDTSRDNAFRSANCGIGITDVMENPLENINIIGVGNAVIEGADNPRATGDAFKTLSLNPTGALSYGSDASNPLEKQTGDWRNDCFLFANCDKVNIDNLKFKDAHGWTVVFERCTNNRATNLDFDNPKERLVNGVIKQTLNHDGVHISYGGSGHIIENIKGITGDDSVALVTIFIEPTPPGVLIGMTVTGNIIPIGDIFNCKIDNVTTNSDQNQVRLLSNEGAKIYDISIEGVIDNGDVFRNNGCISFGSLNPLYASTSFDDIYNIDINNVRAKNRRYCVNCQGGAKNSTISNLIGSPSSTFENVFINPSSFGLKDVTISNTVEHFGTFATAIADEKKVYYGGQKPVKIISTDAYTLLLSDSTRLLHFTNVDGCVVTVPNTIPFIMTFEGTQMTDGQVSFIGGGTMNVRTSLASEAKTASKYSVFGITILSTTESNLFGELELAV